MKSCASIILMRVTWATVATPAARNCAVRFKAEKEPGCGVAASSYVYSPGCFLKVGNKSGTG